MIIKKRLFSLIICLFVATAIALPGTAQAQEKRSFWSIIFPYFAPKNDAVNQPQPEDTLESPFHKGVKQEDLTDELGSLYTPHKSPQEDDLPVNDDLATPHRHQRQIARWLAQTMVELLSIDPRTYKTKLAELEPYINKSALEDLNKFIESSNAMTILTERSMYLSVFVEEEPVVLNKGPVNDRFRWLFEMPVTLTFIPQNLESYEEYTPINNNIVIRAQVGRIPPNFNSEDLQIETLTVRKNTR